VALLDPPNILTDPINSIFGTSIFIPPDVLSGDTLVTIATSTEAVPPLPVTFDFAMSVVEISLENASLTGQATVTLPVLASFSSETARVFHLIGGTWEEVNLSSNQNYGETFLHQQVSFDVTSLSSFVLVIDLPRVDPGDSGGSSGCGLQKARVPQGKGGSILDLLTLMLPALYMIIKRLKVRPV
jgi:hypothetical protein